MNIKETGKNIGWSILGLATIAGVFLLAGIIFLGIAKVTAFIYPIVEALAGLSVVIFFFVVLPLSLIKRFRSAMAATSVTLSMVVGASVWIFSFLSLVYFIGFWTLLLLMWFPSVAFIAAIVLLFNGMWQGAVSIILGIVLTFGMRIFGFWLAEKAENSQYDAEYYEPKASFNGNLPKYCPECGKTYDASWKTCLKCKKELVGNQKHKSLAGDIDVTGKKKILCVDDEPDMLEFYKEFFTEKGYMISTATNGLHALGMVVKNKYDMIITNINMPGINGIELLKSIRELEKKLIAIIVTGDNRYTDEAKRYGCFAYICKPCDLKALVVTVETAFRRENV